MRKMPDVIKGVVSKLRNGMTESEVVLWSCIKEGKLGVKFLRQKPVYVFTEDSWLDRYIIPDFYCFEKKIVIEVDWNIHDLEEVYLLDEHKEGLLMNLWFKIIRFSNDEIRNDLSGVMVRLRNCI